MARIGRNLLAAAALVSTMAAWVAHAPAQDRAEAPPPAVLGTPVFAPPGSDRLATWPPPEYKLPPLDESATRPDEVDPLLAYPQALPPPGWFVNVEVGAVAPHLKNRLTGPVPIAGGVAVIHVPGAKLNWAPSPRFEVGYRLPRGFGEFLATYQFLTTQGQENLASADGVAALKSRLTKNVFDLDYANYRLLADTGFLGEGWLIGGKAGVQVVGVYFDARSAQRGADGTLTGQQTTNNLVGAGPHAEFDLWKRLGASGLSLFGSVEGSSIWGSQRQSFTETILPPGGPLIGATNTSANMPGPADRGTQGVGVLGARLGLSWTPPDNNRIRLQMGYEFDQWYQLGRNTNNGSRGELTEHGIFFRGEFTF